ncbi:UNVERIFIED_CONTAM: hypothetical protein Slati_2412200 [Sesamum latifolium]|uniref:DUF4283 domain-containing protein n=1 Tax=Sesamum latifolium TaxID=2727402 RepID=A0AAW2WFZ1_9LAMI
MDEEETPIKPLKAAPGHNSKELNKKMSYAKTVQQPSAAHFQHDPVRAAEKTFLDEEIWPIETDYSYKGEPGIIYSSEETDYLAYQLKFSLVEFSRLWLRGEWMFDSFHLRIFKWSSDFDPQIDSPIAPVWIRLPGLPVLIFEKNALFTFAAKIGKSLRMDEPTVDISRPDLARVCIEIDLTAPKTPGNTSPNEDTSDLREIINNRRRGKVVAIDDTHVTRLVVPSVAKDAPAAITTSSNVNDFIANEVSYPHLHVPITEPTVELSSPGHVDVATPDDFNYEDPLIAELLDKD